MLGIVIYPPTIDWHYMKQRPQHLMRQFADDGWTVLYFDQRDSDGPVVEQVLPNLFVIRHAAFFMDDIYPSVRDADKKLFWSSWSKRIPLGASAFGADYTVYDCVDDFPDWEKYERRYAPSADAIVCTAESLARKMRSLVPGAPVRLVPNGCDWPHFASVPPKPSDPAAAGGRTIGYVGAWAPWVDEELIRHIGRSFPHDRVVIAGPALREDCGPLGDNVSLRGYVDYDRLPQLLAEIDVCIIPFRRNRITDNTNPIKVYEYLAAGKPVVSTELPEVVRMQPHVYIGATPEAFVDGIRLAFRENGERAAARSAYAKQFGWERRFADIRAMLARHFPDIAPGAPFGMPPSAFGYRSRAYKAEHLTVNSYYARANLRSDPPMAGRTPNGEYACYFRPPLASDLKGAKKIYFEFEAMPSDEEAGTPRLNVSVTDGGWDRGATTYADRPSGTPVGTLSPERRVNESYSIDVTEHFAARPGMSVCLTSETMGVYRIGRPRITIIR